MPARAAELADLPAPPLSEEARRRRRRLTIIQYSLAALLAVVLLGAAYGGVALTVGSMVWTLSPLGWVVLDLVAAVLLAALLVSLSLRPNIGLALAVAFVLVLAAIILANGPLAAFNKVGLIILLVGTVAMFVVGLTARPGSEPIESPGCIAFAAFAGVLVILAGFALLGIVSGGWSRGASEGVARVSFGGEWRLEEITWGFGPVTDDKISVCVCRTTGGLFRQQRVLYTVVATYPDIAWVDAHTARIGGHTIDIFRGATVNAGYVGE